MFIERHEDVGVTALVERLELARKQALVAGERAEAEKFLLGTGADADFEDLPSLPVVEGRHPEESSVTPVESPSAMPPAEVPVPKRRDDLPVEPYRDWVRQLTG